MIPYRMPSLGADMDKATLVEWVKQPGDKLKRGDIVAVVETVKGAIEIETFDEGMLEKHLVSEGETVPVGETLALIRTEDDKTETAEAPPPRASSAMENTAKRKVTPAARKRAREAGVDIESLAPGPDGVIDLAQVEAATVEPAKTPAEKTGESATSAKRATKPGLDLAAMRKAIGAAMARSKREIPHYYVASAIDCTPLRAWLETENKNRTVAERLLYAAPLIKAVARALKETPVLNGYYEEGEFKPSSRIHLGVATALRGGGLIAPALHDTDELSVDDCMAHLRDLVARVRTGRIRGSEMSDPTATISILGDDTADAVAPVIYPPQVAIIGCGAIVSRPWVVNGAVEPRHVMTVTVAGDHRASDGRAAARFLNSLDKFLQAPEAL